MINHDRVASSAEAQQFFIDGQRQLDHLLIGETDAKLGMLVIIAAGVNGVMLGEPGGGKTTIAQDAFRIVDGISNDNLAIIPPESDLKPQKLIGGSSTIVQKNGDEVKTITTEVEPIMHESTQVIWADEINRTSPHAANAMLGALGSREFANTSGRVEMTDLEYAVSTMNPGGVTEGVFKINPANASRHSVGVFLGLGEDEREVDTQIDQIFDMWLPQPGKVKGIISLDDLHAIRNYTRQGIAFPHSVRDVARPKVKELRTVLRGFSIREAVPRLATHVNVNARTVAALRGEKEVTPESIDQAIKFILAARIGMRRLNPEDDYLKAVEAING